MATAPNATPAPAERRGPGCLVALLALPVVVLLGVVIGTVLNRPDDAPREISVTLEEGVAGSTRWRVEAERDVEGEVCAFLYADDEQLTGGCDQTPQDATFGDETVVFGKAGVDDDTVEVALSDGSTIEVETTQADGVEGRFYVQVVPADVDVETP